MEEARYAANLNAETKEIRRIGSHVQKNLSCFFFVGDIFSIQGVIKIERTQYSGQSMTLNHKICIKKKLDLCL